MASERNNNSIKFKNRNIPSVTQNATSASPNKTSKTFQDLKKINWILFLPAIAAIVCYSNGLNGDFVHDDIFAIKNNPDVFGNSRISSLFLNDYWGTPMSNPKSHKSYRPLTVLTFRLNYELTGKNPFYFHLVNCLLHVLVTCLFTYTCKHVLRLTDRCSVFGAMLFAVHPIHVEAVTGIVGRADLLAAVFFLLSFITYTQPVSSKAGSPVTPNRSQLILSVLLAAVAMLCKETGITSLGVCALYDMGMVSRRHILRVIEIRRLTSDCGPIVSRIAILAISGLSLLTFRWWIMNGELPPFQVYDNPASFHESFLTRWLSFSFIWSYNVWLLLAPITLCYDWQTGSIPLVDSVYDNRNQATLAVAMGLAVFVYIALRNFMNKSQSPSHNIAFITLVFTVVPFIPASNLFFRVGFVLAERVLYIPSLGVCIGIASGLERLTLRYRRHTIPLMVLFVTLVMGLSVKTWCQNTIWESRETLFRSGIQAMPHNAKVHYNFANYLKGSGIREDAIEHYREALRLDPAYAQAHNNLGILLEDSSDAEHHYLMAIELVPRHQGAHINLGNHYFNLGDHEKGLHYLNIAMTFDPENPDALTSLATCHIELGNHTYAEDLLTGVIRDHPLYTEAHVSYGGLLSILGKHAESAKHYQKAYKLDMSHSGSLVQAASEYNKLGNIQQAEVLLKQAISTNKEPSALEQLAVLYYRSGRAEESVWIFDEISRIYPNDTELCLKHAKVLANTDNPQKAESILVSILPHDPDNTDIRWTLAHVFSKQGKHLKAIEQLNKTLELAAESNTQLDLFELYNDRANNYKDLKEYGLALKDYKAALEYNAHDANTHGNIGAIYHLYRQFDKAEHHYWESLRLGPGNELVADNLTKLQRLRGQTHSVNGEG